MMSFVRFFLSALTATSVVAQKLRRQNEDRAMLETQLQELLFLENPNSLAANPLTELALELGLLALESDECSCTGLIITGVIVGDLPGGQPKAIELFACNDIPDLSIYGVGSANNGGGTDGEEFTFPGGVSAEAGDFIYVADSTAGAAFNSFFGFNPDYTGIAASINGDDAIELFQNGAVVDVFGDISVSGSGKPWEYMDGWTYRLDGTGPDGTSFVLSHWSFSGKNALDGDTTNDGASTPFPLGTYQC